MGSRRIRVLIVDDHELFAEALAAALSADDRIEPVGRGGTALEGVALAEHLLPDVVLMDLHMPGLDGVDATRMLARLCPSARVVVVTASTSPDDRERALDAGAVTVLTKGVGADMLIDAVLDASSSYGCAA
ncbi:MAG: response regulator transcription factor [Gaiellaceae bacterium]|jgi:DNA-binding NarL/FixJ family response regulator